MKPATNSDRGTFATSRRTFCGQIAGLAAMSLIPRGNLLAAESAVELPVGSAPEPVDFPWFPSRMHAFIWRNWSLLPPTKLADVLGTSVDDVIATAGRMGLDDSNPLPPESLRRASLTVIKRNWHLLPYDQLLQLLDWTAEEMAFTLREDDFFFHKLGLLKPKAKRLRWSEPNAQQRERESEIAQLVQSQFPAGEPSTSEHLFAFVDTLSKLSPKTSSPRPASGTSQALRMGYSYFALYGDSLIDSSLDPYPDGYLARLAESGVNAVWLQGLLSRLSPLPWTTESHIQLRRKNLRALVARAAKHGIRIFLYLNEPRALPSGSDVFKNHPDWRGASESGFDAVCTSNPAVRDGIRDAIAGLCKAVPELGGFFSITASENLTNCWSHGGGAKCPRCKNRPAAEVIAEVNATFLDGIRAANGHQRLLAWDWGWADAWANDVIKQLPSGVELMSVSEWGLPIERGGIKSTVGEYCLSAIGPGPRAQRHWSAAKERGLAIAAKMQVGTTWEIAAVPYFPAVENVCRHVAGLRKLGVESMMLGWTLGGHPSPNIDAVTEIMAGGSIESLAHRRHGADHADAIVAFWKDCSAAFREFPFNIGTVYSAPLQVGPANPLWLKPTGYHASMVGFPYDDLDAWRSIYPADVFANQLEKVARGIDKSVAQARRQIPHPSALLNDEFRFAEVAGIHFASVANQTRFVLARRSGDSAAMKLLLASESHLAIRLHALQQTYSRIGFEASNQYFYVPADLMEKVINCDWLQKQLG